MNPIQVCQRVKAYLKKTKSKFFTFNLKEFKITTYLLKGIDDNVDTDDNLVELLRFDSEGLNIIEVTRISTNSSIEKGIRLLMFLVQVSPETNVNELKNIRTLLYRKIKWEQVRRSEIPQYRNSQGFFHRQT